VNSLRRRFEQNQEDCTFTVLAILPTATENILESLPVEQTLNELQKQREERLAKVGGAAPSEVSTADLPSVVGDEERSLKSFKSESYVYASQVSDSVTSAPDSPDAKRPTPKSKKSKAVLWNEMKINSIARAFTLVYTLALLSLLTRIQLNLLGRRNYLASVVSLASPAKPSGKIRLENRDDDNFDQAFGNDFDTNRKYLSFSWWVLHKGCKDIMTNVIKAVKEVFGPINPREDLTLEKLSQLAVEVRKRVEGATEEERASKRWLPFLLPPVEQEAYVLRESGMTSPSDTEPSSTSTSSPSLRRLVDETADLIDSPPFSHVLTLLLDAGFSLLVDSKIAVLAYKIPPTSASPARVQELIGGNAASEAKAKLANTLAVFCRQAHVIGGGGGVNEYLGAMESVRDLEAFAAVVYSSNFEFEAPDFASTTATTSAERVNEAGAAEGTGRKAGWSWLGSGWASGTHTAATSAAPSALPTPAARAVGEQTASLPSTVPLDRELSLEEDGAFAKAWERAHSSSAPAPSG
jgi:peroxin-3